VDREQVAEWYMAMVLTAAAAATGERDVSGSARR
jgi:hypothetical protein